MYVAERNFKSEQVIKSKIMAARDRGVCDRYGRSYPKNRRGSAGKGDRLRHVDKDRYERNYQLIDWTS